MIWRWFLSINLINQALLASKFSSTAPSPLSLQRVEESGDHSLLEERTGVIQESGLECALERQTRKGRLSRDGGGCQLGEDRVALLVPHWTVSPLVQEQCPLSLDHVAWKPKFPIWNKVNIMPFPSKQGYVEYREWTWFITLHLQFLAIKTWTEYLPLLSSSFLHLYNLNNNNTFAFSWLIQWYPEVCV